MFAAGLLSFTIGFLSLSQEILWVRLFGFANQSLPQAFAFVLMMYLLGIAAGAAMGRLICTRARDLWQQSGVVLLLASIFDLVNPWLYAELAQTQFQVAIGGILIFIMASLKAVIFPIAHHMGAPAAGPSVGRAVSRVYVANIAGATLGPFIMGIALLNVMSTQNCFVLCASMTFLVSIFCLRINFKAAFAVACGFFAVVMFVFFQQTVATSMVGKLAIAAGTIKRIVETRQGIVTIYQDAHNGDIVYGGNVYDGRTNLDPILNKNRINRLLVLAALQDRPQNVLVIGLSIGTWLKLLTAFPGVKNIDVVEINPGYLQAMRDYPPQLSALLDKRVHLYIDDGRRWLRTHPDKKYDLIVMNTSWSWRAYISNLLSQEFMTLLKSHFTPHAVLTYNTTGSKYLLKTAAKVFTYAFLYENFVIAADFDWRGRLQDPQAVVKLAALQLDNKPLFPRGSETLILGYLQEPLYSPDRLTNAPIVTDDNVISEYKYGKSLAF